MMRLAPALLALPLACALAACDASADARQAGQVRYHGHSLEEWWQLRRDPDDATAAEATAAMRTLGAKAVPFLADKAASHDLGDMIGGSVALEGMCPNTLPAMEAARAHYPSPALEQAIRRVQADAPNRARSRPCTADADSGVSAKSR